MARLKSAGSSGKTILVIDDDADFLAGTKRVIEREGHAVLTAPGGREALELLKQRNVDLILVDYLMPGMTGEEFVKELRQRDRLVQIVLQTGYASEQPPREMIKRLDIQGYHDKSEGPEKLCLWVDVGLRAAFAIQLLAKSRAGLRYILNATPELHRIQPLDDLLQGILLQTAGLLGADDSFVAVVSPESRAAGEGFVALLNEGDLQIRAATGRFCGLSSVGDALDSEQSGRLRRAMDTQAASVVDGGTIAPLRVGDMTLGAIYLDRTQIGASEIELVEVFANQAAVAIHNVSLYEMAALDPLTGAYVRRFFEQALLRELRSVHRTRGSVGLLMVDLDDMKRINDTEGHLIGDAALEAAGRLLRRCTRANDIVGRYGGDEFVVLLPNADAAGVEIVARRIMDAFSRLTISAPLGSIHVSGSVGASLLDSRSNESAQPLLPPAFFDQTARELIREADRALYQTKRTRVAAPEVVIVGWPTGVPFAHTDENKRSVAGLETRRKTVPALPAARCVASTNAPAATSAAPSAVHLSTTGETA